MEKYNIVAVILVEERNWKKIVNDIIKINMRRKTINVILRCDFSRGKKIRRRLLMTSYHKNKNSKKDDDVILRGGKKLKVLAGLIEKWGKKH